MSMFGKELPEVFSDVFDLSLSVLAQVGLLIKIAERFANRGSGTFFPIISDDFIIVCKVEPLI